MTKVKKMAIGGMGIANPRPGGGMAVAPRPTAATSKPAPAWLTQGLRNFGAGVAGGAMGMKNGGKVGSASKRADGIAAKGKTKGKIV